MGLSWFRGLQGLGSGGYSLPVSGDTSLTGRWKDPTTLGRSNPDSGLLACNPQQSGSLMARALRGHTNRFA